MVIKSRWFEVIVPQAGMIVLTIGTFFFCQDALKTSKETAMISAVILAATSLIISVFATSDTFFGATLTALSTSLLMANLFGLYYVVAVAAGLVVLGVIILIANNIVRVYDLPKRWVLLSYLTEAAILFSVLLFAFT